MDLRMEYERANHLANQKQIERLIQIILEIFHNINFDLKGESKRRRTLL